MNHGEDSLSKSLVGYVETVSSEIQLLALNIAVAAAKMAQNKNMGLEINQKLSELVNQATQTVKQMNQILNAAKTESKPKNIFDSPPADAVDENLIHDIESAMSGIIKDSEKILRLLSRRNI